MSKKIKSIKTKNVKSTSASVATNATPNFSINSKREIIPISTTSKDFTAWVEPTALR